MNIHSYKIFNSVVHDTHESIPYITAYVSFDPEAVHLHMEEIRQDIQVATSDYLINSPTYNKNILDAVDETISYIEALLQAHHSYTGPTTNPISQLNSSDSWERLTTDIRPETLATTTDTDTAS